jgi:hypothetical protein
MASAPYGVYDSSAEIRNKVSTPAIALMVMAGLTIAVSLLGLLVNLLGVSVGSGAFGNLSQDERIGQLFAGGLGLVRGLIVIVFNILALFGAMRMKALQSYSLAIVSAIVVAFPCCSCCCLIGTPIGIWALIVLFDSQVKAAFRS